MVIANGGEIVLVNASAGNLRWMEWIQDSAQPDWKRFESRCARSSTAFIWQREP